MTKHILIAVAAVGGTLAIAAAGGHAQAPVGRTIALTLSGGKIAAVDEPPRHHGPHSPNSAGDIVIETGRLSGDRAGRFFLHCTAMKPGRDLTKEPFLCHATYVLADGAINATGVIRLEDPNAIHAAVTGGTGAYAGARGTLVGSGPTQTLTLLEG
jgi:hypothetical protein